MSLASLAPVALIIRIDGIETAGKTTFESAYYLGARRPRWLPSPASTRRLESTRGLKRSHWLVVEPGDAFVNVGSSASKISNCGSNFRRRLHGWIRKLKERFDEERTGFPFEREA